MNYYVICRRDNIIPLDGGTECHSIIKGKYALATSRSFPTFDEAEKYSEGVAPSREPRILLEVTPLSDKEMTPLPDEDVYFGMNDKHY